MNAPRTVVLIHGLFLTRDSWDGWIERYAARGLNAVALAWPGLDRTVAELRADPAPLTTLNLAAILDGLESEIRMIDREAIVIGHSFGGLFAQLLAYRGIGSAIVGLDAAAPAGVQKLPFVTLRASAPVLSNPLNAGGATMLTADQFHYAFTNTESETASLALYERYAVPCANRVFFEGALENFVPHSPAHIDVTAERAPILLIAGSEDHLVTPGYTEANHALIAQSPSLTAMHEFMGRPHFLGHTEGWEEIADYTIEWALANAVA